MSLNLILNQVCDPVAYVQVMRLLEKVHNRKRNALAIQVNEASGLMWSGQFSDALALAESLRKYKVSIHYQFSLLNLRFNCYRKLEDLEGAMQVKRETEVLVSSFTKPSMQKMRFGRAELCMWWKMPGVCWRNCRKRNKWKEPIMGKEQLRSKIEEQQAVYEALKAENDSTVCYKEFHNGK